MKQAALQALDPATLWAAAQLAPGEGIEDALERIRELLEPIQRFLDLADQRAALRELAEEGQEWDRTAHNAKVDEALRLSFRCWIYGDVELFDAVDKAIRSLRL